ncbi:UNVERIFIED_CONTAM: hypothetical protein GTU68_040179 [Idotea baltica]|nr:hypothetical protein [Idotea baltica]
MEIAKSISHGLAKKVISVKIDNEVWDANRPIEKDAAIQLLTWDDKDGQATFWHSSAHIMAEALEALYPGVKLGIGPSIDAGFYYDIDFGDKAISENDFPKIEKDLPLRISEFGTVYRYEQSGELHGLSRVRGFTQDDAHIFCTPDQLKSEFLDVLELTMSVLDRLGFKEFTAQISLRDPEDKEKYIGSDENWEKAERAIIEATAEKGIKTTTELGEAAFYGPKLDFMVKDALKRSWQLGTIQVDYNLPERFELEYVGSDNEKHRPVMIHRAPFGSFERFLSVLIENCAGNFPLWLAPDQIAVLPISDKFIPYAKEVNQELLDCGFRSAVDERNEKVGKKIRDAEVSKVPYMLVIGEKEVEAKEVAIRKHGEGDQGKMSIPDFLTFIKQKLEE